MGGAERLIYDLALAARAAGLFETVVWILGPPGDLTAQLDASGIENRSFGATGPYRLARLVPVLARGIAAGHFDVVHTHLIHASAAGLLAARLARARCAVMTRHYERYVWMYGTRTERVLHRLGHRLAHHIFAISNAARTVLVDTEGIDPSRVTTVLNGVDPDRIRRMAGAYRRPASRPADLIVGTIGSLHARKGHADLIEALARSREQRRLALVLIGSGPERPRLEALTARLDLVGKVDFAGYDASPYPRLSEVDIYVQPSLEEGFGISVLEAMALGKAVIATDAGGLPEIVTPTTGILVRAGDADGLAKAIDRLASSAGERELLGRSASAHVDARFHIRLAASRHADTYERLAGSGHFRKPIMT